MIQCFRCWTWWLNNIISLIIIIIWSFTTLSTWIIMIICERWLWVCGRPGIKQSAAAAYSRAEHWGPGAAKSSLLTNLPIPWCTIHPDLDGDDDDIVAHDEDENDRELIVSLIHCVFFNSMPYNLIVVPMTIFPICFHSYSQYLKKWRHPGKKL